MWIGGTRPGNAVFVPPPPRELADCLTSFERFLHDDPEPTPALVKAALAHVQFETIHPFLDGNGRVGRLLITLQLINDALLSKPLLYLSLHFQQRRQTYYDLLNAVRSSGDWETWLEFFLDAVKSTASEATEAANRLHKVATSDARRIEKLGRTASSALAVHRALQKRPIATASTLVKATRLTMATVNKSLAHLERIKIVSELTEKRRGRIFSYSRYAGILNEGMERPPS